MLSNSTIDSVREVAIEDIISNYATLKPAGQQRLKSCCPLHDEKTPSFVVDKAKNTFRCYGCGEGGDAIQFIMIKEHLQFIDAVKFIADKQGIRIDETETKGKTEEQINEEKIYLDLLQQANKQYIAHRADVLDYLTGPSRRLKPSTLIDWQIGYCHDWKVIAPTAINSGLFNIAEKFGLVRKSEGGNVWDFFHHRVTIPIHSATGQLIGFGGRIKPGEEGAKYFNPAESPVYPKAKTLFGLDKARKHFHRHGMAVLVEGYFDTITLHQNGWDNTVGTCGTALTQEQAKLLRRYTDTVLVVRDGDKAGRKAMMRDIPILAAEQFTIYVLVLPDKQDPDSFFQRTDGFYERVLPVLHGYRDGIEFLAHTYLLNAFMENTAAARTTAIEQVVLLLDLITNQVRREQYIKIFTDKKNPDYKEFDLKSADLTKPLDALLKRREEERKAAEKAKEEQEVDQYESLPSWVDRKRMEIDGFIQLKQDTKGYKAGIYFVHPSNRNLYRVTNFTINPLYHIFEQSNNRRLIEVDNTEKSAVIEVPTQAFVNQGMFEVELLHKGTFRCEDGLSRKEFKRITGWLLDSMPIAYELKTLGWQPEGFFAYSDRAYHDGQLVKYDDLGMIKVEDRYFMSLGNSKIHRDERQTENPYENDLFLKYVEPRPSINIEKWAKLFFDSYGNNAPYGIAFVFLTLFKDIVTRITKMPLLYCYGQKGSGKSAMAESITWIFFSGKDGEGNLIKGFNLNPGQSTPFSFFNRLERFRNCPILMNEFDENAIEPWKTGAFKAAYDGEGREVGDGSTGKKKKTVIQKVQGTLNLVGQYMATKDDGSVSSRCVPCNFSLERLKQLTAEQIASYNELRREEQEGLSGMLVDLLKHRPEMQKRLAKNFGDVQTGLMSEMRTAGYRIEARLISNYSIMLAATKTLMELGIRLPYTYDEFYSQAKERMIKHNQTLRDNSIVNQFWKSVEVLFDNGLVKNGTEIQITRYPSGINIKEGSNVSKKDVQGDVLLLRLSNVYSLYAKHHRERSGQAAQNEETILMYLKEQTYYIGLTPYESFSDKRTSAFAFNYDAMKDMGIVLEKNHSEPQPQGEQKPEISDEELFKL